MKRFFTVTMIMVLVLSTFFAAGSVSRAKADESKVLEFNTMVPVSGPYVGAANPIRGIPGGGLPWVIEFGKGKLSPDGTIDIMVKGLVLESNGTNPSPQFKAIVSCMSIDAGGNANTVNVETGLFPADTEGNAHIQDIVALPQPCIAPIIFVTNPGGRWFAVTGF